MNSWGPLYCSCQKQSNSNNKIPLHDHSQCKHKYQCKNKILRRLFLIVFIVYLTRSNSLTIEGTTVTTRSTGILYVMVHRKLDHMLYLYMLLIMQ